MTCVISAKGRPIAGSTLKDILDSTSKKIGDMSLYSFDIRIYALDGINDVASDKK